MAETYQGKTREETILIKVDTDYVTDAVHLHTILNTPVLQHLYGPAVISEVLERLTVLLAEEAYKAVKDEVVPKLADRLRKVADLIV